VLVPTLRGLPSSHPYFFTEPAVEEKYKIHTTEEHCDGLLGGVDTFVASSMFVTFLSLCQFFYGDLNAFEVYVVIAEAVATFLAIGMRVYLTRDRWANVRIVHVYVAPSNTPRLRLEAMYEKNIDISHVFFVIYCVGVITSTVSGFIIYLHLHVLAEGLRNIDEEEPLWSMLPQGGEQMYEPVRALFWTWPNGTDGGSVYQELFGLGFDEVDGEAWIKRSQVAPLLHAFTTYMLPGYYIVVQVALNELIGKMVQFGPLQVSFIVFVQTVAVWGFYLNPYSNASFWLMLPSLTLVPVWTFMLPAWRHLVAQHRESVASRAAFVRCMITGEENEALARDLDDAEANLQELFSKLELTEDQLQLIKGSTEGLEALRGYHIDVEAELQFERKIGEGGFGIVYLAKFRGETVAVKQLISDRIDKASIESFKNEILLLTQLHHPNICQVLAAAWEAPHLAIVLEYAKEGDLQVSEASEESGAKRGTAQLKTRFSTLPAENTLFARQ